MYIGSKGTMYVQRDHTSPPDVINLLDMWSIIVRDTNVTSSDGTQHRPHQPIQKPKKPHASTNTITQTFSDRNRSIYYTHMKGWI